MTGDFLAWPALFTAAVVIVFIGNLMARGVQRAIDEWAVKRAFRVIGWRKDGGFPGMGQSGRIRVRVCDAMGEVRQFGLVITGGVRPSSYWIEGDEMECYLDEVDGEGEWWLSAPSRWEHLERRIRADVEGRMGARCRFVGREPVELEKGLMTLRAAMLKGALASHQTLIDEDEATVRLKVWDQRTGREVDCEV